MENTSNYKFRSFLKFFEDDFVLRGSGSGCEAWALTVRYQTKQYGTYSSQRPEVSRCFVDDGARSLCRKDEERVLARLSTAKYLRRLNIHGFSDRFHVGHEVRERALIFIFIYLFIYVFVWVPYFLVGSSDIWFVGTFRRHSCCLKPIFIAKFDH